MLDEELVEDPEINEEIPPNVEPGETEPVEPTTPVTDNSILKTIRKMILSSADCEDYDTDIIIHINTALMTLTQLGVGPSKGFAIFDKSAIWTDFVADVERIEAIKTYIYLKVKLVFDPPQSAAGIESYNKMITELEWRINVAAETRMEED